MHMSVCVCVCAQKKVTLHQSVKWEKTCETSASSIDWVLIEGILAQT